MVLRQMQYAMKWRRPYSVMQCASGAWQAAAAGGNTPVSAGRLQPGPAYSQLSLQAKWIGSVNILDRP